MSANSGLHNEHLKSIMKENKYKLDILRLFSLWFTPIITIAIFLYFTSESISTLKSIQILPIAMLFSICIVPFLFLFINHLLKEKNTELKIGNDEITISRDGKKETVIFSDILNINQYSTYRMPWSSIIKWEIITAKKKYTVSSLSISKLNFERYFLNKIKYKTDFFPTC